MPQDIPLDSMSVSEKLQLMEEVWTSLCENTGDVQSPDWHEEVLTERRRRLESGETKVSSWDEAKARLSKLGQ
ncbi:MAG: addiction module protein [Planctomycetota bacterium]